MFCSRVHLIFFAIMFVTAQFMFAATEALPNFDFRKNAANEWQTTHEVVAEKTSEG